MLYKDDQLYTLGWIRRHECLVGPGASGAYLFPFVSLCHLVSRLTLKRRASNPTLPNDRLQCSNPQFRVIRYRNRHRPKVGPPLHNDMASALTDYLKTLFFENAADIPPGEDAELTHWPLRSG